MAPQSLKSPAKSTKSPAPAKTPTSSRQQPTLAAFFSVSPQRKKSSLSPMAKFSASKFSSTKETNGENEDPNTPAAATKTPKQTPISNKSPKASGPCTSPTPKSKTPKKEFMKSPTKDDMKAIVLGPMLDTATSISAINLKSSSPKLSTNYGLLPDIDGLPPSKPTPTRKSVKRTRKNTSAAKKSGTGTKKTTTAKKEEEAFNSVKRKLDAELEESHVVEDSTMSSAVKKRKTNETCPVIILDDSGDEQNVSGKVKNGDSVVNMSEPEETNDKETPMEVDDVEEDAGTQTSKGSISSTEDTDVTAASKESIDVDNATTLTKTASIPESQKAKT
eukprot:8350785-Ditylum_brightwellii.AAC.1